MILLWGIPEDAPLVMVQSALEQRGASVLFLDQHAIRETSFDFCVGSEINGVLRVGSRSCNLEDVSAAYIRPYESSRFLNGRNGRAGGAVRRHAIEIDRALSAWLELTPALIVNRLMVMAGNSSKPYQARQIRSFGFQVPDTLITTEAAAALEFWERHGTVIYKSISSVRSIVSRLPPSAVNRLKEVKWCPTQFQEYIPGTDIRVHVVGTTVYACEITSDADDYRYAWQQGGTIDFRPYDLPDEYADRCRRLTRDMGLLVAGIDLRRTPDGRWYCFEVNASPGFTFFEAHTGHPIGQSVAELLMGGSVA
jgi:glutathione synthase/RimK-type ligase-like ATP-grasp enzyme